MEANIKCYSTNADVFFGEKTFSISYDYQGRIFDNEEELIDCANELLESVKDADNYSEVFDKLVTALDRYRNF